MVLFQSLIVGAVQGVTEWIPISSEGINSIVMTQFFGASLTEALILAIWLHIGTLLAAAVYLRKDIIHVLKERGPTFNFLIVATVVSAIIAAPLLLISTEFFLLAGRSVMILIGILLIITGLIQFYAKKQTTQEKKITIKDAVITGIAQGLAILPGLSRSGLTISVLLFRGYKPAQSIKLSFLMSIPAIVIAGAWSATKTAAAFTTEGLISLTTAFILGLITIAVLLKIAERVNFSYFCFLIGVLAIVAGLI